MPDIKEKLNSVVRMNTFSHPHFSLAWARFRNLVRADPSLPFVAGIAEDGVSFWNPDQAFKLPDRELFGIVCHEMMHVLLAHETRVGAANRKLWNIATDMVINASLKDDHIALPSWVLYPPAEYQGPRRSEELYLWLLERAKSGSGGQNGEDDGTGEPNTGAGCGVKPSGNQGDQGQNPMPGLSEMDKIQIGQVVREMAQQVGTGTSAIASLLTPREPLLDWREVLRTGCELASGQGEPAYQTYSRRSRRSPLEGIQRPGWISTSPRVAIVIDVSGSMDRNWISQIVSETRALLDIYPQLSAYLVTHTDRVVYHGHVTRDSHDDVMSEATSFTGGTDAGPAYEDVRNAAQWVDVLIHFTDCELFGTWPEVPADQLVVGAFGSGARNPHTTPPAGALVLPCHQ